MSFEADLPRGMVPHIYISQILQGTAFAVFTLINKCYSVQIVLQNFRFFLLNKLDSLHGSTRPPMKSPSAA